MAEIEAQQSYELTAPAETNTGGEGTTNGVTHLKSFRMDSPIDSIMDFHAGKEDQIANQRLVSFCLSRGFKVQKDFHNNDPNYWSSDHKLLDTAYIVSQYTIGEGETTIPKIEFVVRGKFIKCFNYDGSFKNSVSSSAIHDNFNLGDTVHAVKTDNTVIEDNLTIIDKFKITGRTEKVAINDVTNYTPVIQTRYILQKSDGTRFVFPILNPVIHSFKIRKGTASSYDNNIATGGEITCVEDGIEKEVKPQVEVSSGLAVTGIDSLDVGPVTTTGTNPSAISNSNQIVLSAANNNISLGDEVTSSADSSTTSVVTGISGNKTTITISNKITASSNVTFTFTNNDVTLTVAEKSAANISSELRQTLKDAQAVSSASNRILQSIKVRFTKKVNTTEDVEC